MSYFTFPRLHFSGTFKAYPSTINNTPGNYQSSIYPNIEEVELGWGPKGNGEFDINCTVTMVEYEDGSSASTPEEDPIIGEPFIAVPNPHFIAGSLVDLDPDQQSVSELWGMKIQIGGNEAYIRGDYAPAAFSSMWKNVQGENAPHSSASFSGMYQSVLSNLKTEGLIGHSKFLNYFNDNPAAKLSVNFIVEAHNNNPEIYSFNKTTFNSLRAAGVSQTVLDKIQPMQQMRQQNPSKSKYRPKSPVTTLGNIPTKDFVTYQLQQYLSTEEYNASIDNILNLTQVIEYQPTTPYDFSYGFLCGTVGTSLAEASDYFVPSRMMTRYNNNDLINFAPFSVSADGQTVSLNLSNSLPVENPGTVFYEEKIGELRLVYFPNAAISIENAITIASIPYMETGFLEQYGGMFTITVDVDLSRTPLGIISILGGTQVILLTENEAGYYLRANQFVFRMNPGVETTTENPRGETATVEIHALKFGKPVIDGTQISITTMAQPGLGRPKSALTVSPTNEIAETLNGVARFTLTASDPGNPRDYINGQLYFKEYGFADPMIATSYVQDPNDFISIQVYNQHADEVAAIDILKKYGYLYKIMGFLANDSTVEGIDMRNMIKTLLQRPFSDIRHMPVTRDLSIANRQKIIAWIDGLNSATGQPPIA